MPNVAEEVQNEVRRIREMIAETKALLPNANANFAFYEIALSEADRAVREQDASALVKVLPVLRDMQ